MKEPEDICRVCLKPKAKASGGFHTVFIASCRCEDMPPAQESSYVRLCSACGKRIYIGRSGTLTQWILSSNACSCKNPSPTQFPESKEHPAHEEAPELPVDRSAFPIERYKPELLLGSGGSGKVYLCRDRVLAKKVAVKILHNLTPEQLITFQKEARTTSKLNHPNIIRVFDFGPTETGVPYLVLEYLENAVNLQKFITDNGALPLDLCIRILLSVSSALIHAHSIGILHRDLKPSNILLYDTESGDKDVKLIDFGVARIVSENQEPTFYQNRTLVGTPQYMSPEQAQGKSYDARSEIYALGCVLFEALTGLPLFRGNTDLETISMHVNQEPQSLSEATGKRFPVEIEALIRRCLAKEPEDRFNSAQALLNQTNAIENPEIQELTSQMRLPQAAPLAGFRIDRALVRSIVLCALMITVMAAFLTSWFKPARQDHDVETSKVSLTKKLGHSQNESIHNQSSDNNANEPEIALADNGRFKWDLDMTPGATNEEIMRLITSQRNLRRINLNETGITDDGLNELVNRFPHLKEISVRRTIVSDRGIKALCKVRTLQGLYLSSSRVDDAGMEFVAKLTGLRRLAISGTDVSDTGLSPLRSLINLETLHMEGVNATDKSADVFAHMTRLCEFQANQTKLSGITIGQLPGSLGRLFLNDCSLGDRDLLSLNHLTKLSELSLQGNPITDEGSRNFLPCRKLEWLALNRTKIGDEGMKVLSDLPRLRYLFLNDCPITEKGMANLASYRNLIEIQIKGTKVSKSKIRELMKTHRSIMVITD